MEQQVLIIGGGASGMMDNSDLNQRAEKIADAVVEQVAQVKDARTVISEKMAYVSVAIDETADTAESATLKDEISQVVKKTDTEIDTVYVMEDADTFTRMKEIGEDIANGKPISGFAEELENLFVRVTPTKEYYLRHLFHYGISDFFCSLVQIAVVDGTVSRVGSGVILLVLHVGIIVFFVGGVVLLCVSLVIGSWRRLLAVVFIAATGKNQAGNAE